MNSITELKNARNLLEIGGGDGTIANRILQLNSEIKIVLVDVSSNIGSFIDKNFLNRVTIIPECSLGQYVLSKDFQQPDIITVSDVVHHIPEKDREQFLKEVTQLLKKGSTLIIKEIEPEGIKAKLSILADKYISGDMNTRLVKKHQLISLIKRVMPSIKYQESNLFLHDKPNYSISFYPPHE